MPRPSLNTAVFIRNILFDVMWKIELLIVLAYYVDLKLEHLHFDMPCSVHPFHNIYALARIYGVSTVYDDDDFALSHYKLLVGDLSVGY